MSADRKYTVLKTFRPFLIEFIGVTLVRKIVLLNFFNQLNIEDFTKYTHARIL